MKQPKYSKKLEYLNIDMTLYKTILTTKYKERKPYKKSDPKKITALIPGTIRRVYVKEGQKVSAGERLLVLEAMKMRNYIRAPFDATIRKIHVEISNPVYKEQPLLEFE
ncbi:MAG: acetyl-CoA carboxylase biotin carboxyl carrier protein subunit [Bacteroidales bacterium]